MFIVERVIEVAMSEVVDGRVAALKVKQSFIDVHGPMGVIAFEVRDILFDETNQTWKVTCGFFTGFLSAAKFFYDVVVDSNGTIRGVTKLPPSEYEG